MPKLSVCIPARNEMFLAKTVETILANIKDDTEIIAVCDGSWPDPCLMDNDRLTVLKFTVPIGQRAAMNQAARVSRAKYIMKLDGHSSVDEGFDTKLMAPYENKTLDWDVTTIPRMYNLHAFDWECQDCHWAQYQGPKPTECGTCKSPKIERNVKWQPRMSRRTDFARFDSTMHFQYWKKYYERSSCDGTASGRRAGWMSRMASGGSSASRSRAKRGCPVDARL
jgi:glycosyltransferase involved in cell wall biosynthesis